MESLKTLETYDASLKIRQYLEKSYQTINSEDPAELGFSSRLCANILEVFRQMLLLLSNSNNRSLSRSGHISLERSFSQLKLWSDGYGVSRGELDRVLDKSRQLRRDTLKLLRSIGINLTERLLPHLFGKSLMTESLGTITRELKAAIEYCHGGGDDDGSTSSEESADSLEDNVQEMTMDLQTDTLCLMELGEVLEDPVLDSVREADESAALRALMGWAPHQPFCDKVESRFPRATQLLVDRLGKSNYERYIRCQQSRHHNELKTTTEESENPLLTNTLDGSTFHDSGLGSSIPAAPSYAETMMSYGSTRGRSVRVPALPAEGKAGQSFTCLVCGNIVRISNNKVWKQHIYSDLQPWLCLDMSCTNGDRSFENINDWVSHLSLDHNLEPQWESLKCPLCHVETGSGKIAVTRHLGAHLEEISLGALPIEVDSESESESDSELDVQPYPEEIDQHIMPVESSSTVAPMRAAGVPPATVSHISQLSKVALNLADYGPSKVETVEEEPYTIKCICGFTDDDGSTIYCEKCDTWQHIECYYPNNTQDAYREDFAHECVECSPRHLDRNSAFERQRLWRRKRPYDEDATDCPLFPSAETSNMTKVLDQASSSKATEANVDADANSAYDASVWKVRQEWARQKAKRAEA